MQPARLKRVQAARGSAGAVVSVAALALIPPPFPFTAFVLTSGALRVNAWTFFGDAGGASRLLRFGVEARWRRATAAASSRG